jgi:DNA-binding beta-propeller fold protein YncE
LKNTIAATALAATALAFGEHAITLSGHGRDAHAVACSADGKLIASGGEDEKTIVWDVAAGGTQVGSAGAGGAVQAVAISPQGNRIAAGERYHKVKLLDGTGKELKILEGHEAAILGVGFSADGKVLFTFSLDGGLRQWDANTGAPQGVLPGQRDSYTSAAFSPDGKWFLGGTSGGNLYLFNLTTKKPERKMQAGSQVRAVAVSPDGGLIAISLGNESVRLLNRADGQEKAKIEKVDANGLAFAKDGKHLAAAGHDNNVKVIDVATAQVVSTMKGHDRTVRSVCYLPDGRVASASFDKTIRIWPAVQ